MSASVIPSLLRVMTTRDAEAIVLESGKVPSLRRRGQLEPMAMGALEPSIVEEFAAPHLLGKDVSTGPLMLTIEADGASYVTTIEQVGTGLRLSMRRGAPPKATPRPATAAAAVPAAAAVAVAVAVAVPAAAAELHSRLSALLSPAVSAATSRSASDIFLSTAQPARIRVEGRLETLELHTPPDDDELSTLVSALAGAAGSADLSLDVAGQRVRLNAFAHLNGHALAARLIRDRVPALTDLALPPELSTIVEHRDGLVLVCGPTGAGKSTTLAALVDLIDQRRSAHVITLEDPIEYRFTPRRSLIHQRELGTHFTTFADGLRAALREAPDVILLGELRDRDTLAAALTAAETGHLVLATLHAPSAAGAIDRVIDAFPDSHQRQIRVQLSAALRAIVTQYLLPRRDGGRAAAVELVPVTTAVANIIRKGDLHTLPTAIQSGREAGMIPLERSLARLAESGIVSPQVIRKIATDHDLLASLSPTLTRTR